MIRSTKVSLKFANKEKLANLKMFIAEYRRVVGLFIDIMWELDKVPVLPGKDITNSIQTWLSARALQCAGKQASAIVRGTKQKHKQREWAIAKFVSEGKLKRARKLQKIADSAKYSKPTSSVQPELDYRFIKLDLQAPTSFDSWITLQYTGNKLKIRLPFRKTEHFNNLFDLGKLRPGVRISENSLTFMFELPDPVPVANGKTIGVDIGKVSALSVSTGQVVEKDKHGHTYSSICSKLARKKRGSKRFKKAATHRTNFINWSVNQLNLSGVKRVNIERIRHMKRGVRCNRSMTHWNYAELVGKLKSKIEEAGVQLVEICPTYTSQRCSVCGWVRKGNRNGKTFKCDKCSFAADADLNAATNISLDLLPISAKERLKQLNRKGFYWPVLSDEPIVRHAQRINNNQYYS